MRNKFIPTECGWVSEKTPPTHHNNVVILIFDADDNMYMEVIGFYDDCWELDKEYQGWIVKGWIPIPYTPNNH